MPRSSMKVLVVGSIRTDKDESLWESQREGIEGAGRAIGRELARRGHSVAVGSDCNDDVDPFVVAGAREQDPECPVEVHVPTGDPRPYYKTNREVDETRVEIVYHQFPDWDVTVMDTIDQVDGVIAVGGRAGVIQTGLAAWKMGTPVIPISCFGGGGGVVGQYGSSARQVFYRGALTDSQIDQLAGPWRGDDSARRVVDSLEAVARRVSFATSSRLVIALSIVLTLAAAAGWVAALTIPYLGDDASGIAATRASWVLGFFASITLAGLLGAAMQTLRRLRDGHRLEGPRSLIDVILGVAAGLVTAMLFLMAELVVRGEIAFEWDERDYIRVTLLGSMASLFASLYLDNALSRFDTVRQSVMEGTYER